MTKWREERVRAYKRYIEKYESDNEQLERQYKESIERTRRIVERISENDVKRRKDLEKLYDGSGLLRINGEWVEGSDN
ncbi:hypothetical protein OCF63_12235 [Bacillus wiedmannii]|uniref:hypothetical protein n=1 Tax=Bacillus wiedmannii TaxID=1890302 RepID=UPI0021D03CDF|nr:hypothetical protein [Bacillus wiedmannii]MCU5498764.1 hypothetical protein [Bacillus wiedmannii]